MHFHHRESLEAVAELGIPDAVVLTYGTAMVTRGIRPPHTDGDIDIATTLNGNLYLEHVLGFQAVRHTIGLDKEGNERYITARRDAGNKFDSFRWAFSPARFIATGKGRMYLPELIELSDQDDETGIWVPGVEGLLLMTADSGRPDQAKETRRIWQFHDQGY